MRSMLLACVATSALACSAPPQDGVTTPGGDDASPAVDPNDASVATTTNDAAPAKKCGTKVDVDAPMFLFYGLYDNAGDSKPTLELAPTAGGEPTVTINRGAKTDPNLPEFDAWKKRGGKVARTVDRLPETLDPWFAAGTAKKWFVDQLTSGFDYVTIDELKDAPEWLDGHSRSKGFVQLLDDLAAAGFDRRVALYVNAYNLAGNLHLYKEALRACRDHCRVIALEIYVTVSDVFAPRRDSAGHCEGSTACFEALAAELESVAPGSAGRAITILGTADTWNQGSASADCTRAGGGHGALWDEYATLHSGKLTKQQPGVGAFSLGAVTPNGSFTPMDQATCMHSLDAWSFPRATGKTAPECSP